MVGPKCLLFLILFYSIKINVLLFNKNIILLNSQATFVLKRLCETIANKTNHYLSQVVSHFRCRLSFALLRSSLICLRGTRSTKLAFEENDFDYSIHRLNVGHQ